jgi:hypothetical protein
MRWQGCQRRVLRAAAVLALLVMLGAAPSGARAGLPLLGFSDQSMRWSDAGDTRLGQLATAARDLGSSSGVPTATWRMNLSWADVQAGFTPNPSYYWRTYDRIYSALRAKGIKPLWVVQRAPTWATSMLDLCPPAPAGNCPPADKRLGAWRSFVKNVVLRYPESAGIEVWNEPNLHRFWGTFVDPGRYSRVLSNAYAGVQDAVGQLAPSMPAGWSMPVLLAAPADPSGGGLWREMTAVDWMKALYDEFGARRDFDALAWHVYPNPQTVPPDQATPSLLGALDTFANIRDAHGDAAKPIWVTEIGWHTVGSIGSHGQPTDPAHQGKFLRCAYGLLVDSPRNVVAFVINNLVDQSPYPKDQEGSFGLLASDLSFKAPPPDDGYSILQGYFARPPSPVTSCE